MREHIEKKTSSRERAGAERGKYSDQTIVQTCMKLSENK